MKKVKKIQLAFGGTTKDPLEEYLAIQQRRIGEQPNMIENPNTAIAENNIRLASAQKTANDNPWTQGMDILGNIGLQVGGALMTKGIGAGEGADGKGIAGFLNKNKDGFSSLMALLGGGAQMAYGGAVGGGVEVEGKEAFETPGGAVGTFKGPSHEAGGIDVNLPPGTEVYSKRIKIDGVTLANRKTKREKRSLTLEELLEADKTDNLIKNSLTRTKTVNEKEEALDNQVQDVVGKVLNPNQSKLAYGTPGPTNMDKLKQWSDFLTQFGTRGGNIEEVAITAPRLEPLGGTPAGVITNPSISSSSTNPTENEEKNSKGNFLSDLLGDINPGDVMSLLGDYKSAFDPMKNTLANRAGDTPNVNAYKDFGVDGLAALEKGKDSIIQVKDEALKDSQLGRNAAILRNRGTARGLNTQRALDIQADNSYIEAENKLNTSASQQMSQLYQTQAQMENQQDSVVMRGEEGRDLADRQDRDNFYSQIAQDISSRGQGIQQLGKDMNAMKLGKTQESLVNNLLMDKGIIIKNGKITYSKEKQAEIDSAKTKKEKDAIQKEADAYYKQAVAKTVEEVSNRQVQAVKGAVSGLTVSPEGKYILNGIEMDDQSVKDLQTLFSGKFLQGKGSKTSIPVASTPSTIDPSVLPKVIPPTVTTSVVPKSTQVVKPVTSTSTAVKTIAPIKPVTKVSTKPTAVKKPTISTLDVENLSAFGNKQTAPPAATKVVKAAVADVSAPKATNGKVFDLKAGTINVGGKNLNTKQHYCLVH